MSDDPRDLIEQDMARHERLVGREVSALRNQSMAAEALELVDRQRKAHPDEPPPVAPTPTIEHRIERRELNGQRYVMDIDQSENPYRSATEFEANVIRHAQPRIDLLLTKKDEGALGQPSWRTRTLAAMYFKIKSLEAGQSGRTDEADVFERAFQQDLYELLEESNKLFGNWRTATPGRLIVGVP